MMLRNVAHYNTVRNVPKDFVGSTSSGVIYVESVSKIFREFFAKTGRCIFSIRLFFSREYSFSSVFGCFFVDDVK